MADYSGFIALAERLIAKKGMEMTWIRISMHGEIDPVTGKRREQHEEIQVMGVCSRPTKEELQNGRFQNCSMLVLVPGNAVAKASITDRLRFSGREWEIGEIVEIAPAGEVVLYKLGVRESGQCSRM